MRLLGLAGFAAVAVLAACDDGSGTVDVPGDTSGSGDTAGGSDTGGVESGSGEDGVVDSGGGSDDDTSAEVGCRHGLDDNGDGVCDGDVAQWWRGAPVPLDGSNADIYHLGDRVGAVASRGVLHTHRWPVTVSGVLLPWDPVMRMFDPAATDANVLNVQSIARNSLGFGNTTEMYAWLGLPQYEGSGEALPGIPWPAELHAGDFLGAAKVSTPQGDALTFSCATCHSAEVFGRTVYGATNRRSRANVFFHLAKQFFPSIPPAAFATMSGANDAETAMFTKTRSNLSAIGSHEPQVTGLDTSLAHVSLSLSRREEDAYATRNPALETRPRANQLASFVADSKPQPWWTLRFKNRWLADGSIVSGNPVFTNFLWNEIGRGTDLHELQQWLVENQRIVDELTVAVFATTPPRWENWFGADSIDIEAAKRGQALFNATCSRCHGTYAKGWDDPATDVSDHRAMIQTSRITYFEQTLVQDVGTDLQRAEGMSTFADVLNGLEISQQNGTVVEVQQGYVAPPLNGLWVRYPYFHNGSAPTLCDVLTAGPRRTTEFWNGPAHDPATDFDAVCVGYPRGEAIPASWKEDAKAHYDTTIPGLSNQGHDEWLVNPDGSDLFSAEQKSELIAYLKTL